MLPIRRESPVRPVKNVDFLRENSAYDERL